MKILKNKKISMALWILFVIFTIGAIFLNGKMRNSTPEYEEVKVTVLSAKTTQVVNKNTGNRTNFYEVKVRYNDKTYDLENAHNTYMYKEGALVTAYLYQDRLFADVDGVKTSTPVATIYFVCLFGAIGSLFLATMTIGNKKKTKES